MAPRWPREIGTCHAGDNPRAQVLRAELYERHAGDGWELEVRELRSGGRRLSHVYATEADARRALDEVYELGRRQIGGWTIQRVAPIPPYD